MKATKTKAVAARKTKKRSIKPTRSDKPTRVRANKTSEPQVQIDAVRADTKLSTIIKLLSRREGATLAQMSDATGWQTHSVRGFLAPAIVQAAIDGKLPPDLVTSRIRSDLPLSWTEQRKALDLD